MVRRGSILIIALWTLCLLTVLAVILSAGVRQKLVLVQRLNERAEGSLIAGAGIECAIMQIMREEPKGWCALKDSWSVNPGVFKGIPIGGGSFETYSTYAGPDGMPLKRWGLVDEQRKININTADLGTMQRLFQAVLGCDVMMAQELAACIIDWRDADSQLAVPTSAEDSYYSFLEHSYEAKNTQIEVLDELLLIKGIGRDIFEKIRDYVTVYGDGKVNVNTAPLPVLLALGFSQELAEKIIRFRNGDDGVEATADDRIIETLAGLASYLSTYYNLNDMEIEQLKQVSDSSLTTDSAYFMVYTAARLRNRDHAAQILCVISREGKILYWRES